jgi:hypothetical protein
MAASRSEEGILATLAACVAAAFPPALALTFAALALRRRRTMAPPPRVWWIAAVGLSWSFVLLFIYLPGMDQVFLEGQNILLLLHPVVAILSAMGTSGNGLFFLNAVWSGDMPPYLWGICSLAYVAGAFWLFLVAVLRIRRLRAG